MKKKLKTKCKEITNCQRRSFPHSKGKLSRTRRKDPKEIQVVGLGGETESPRGTKKKKLLGRQKINNFPPPSGPERCLRKPHLLQAPSAQQQPDIALNRLIKTHDNPLIRRKQIRDIKLATKKNSFAPMPNHRGTPAKRHNRQKSQIRKSAYIGEKTLTQILSRQSKKGSRGGKAKIAGVYEKGKS